MSEVAKHKYVDDIWIVVDGRVYDISEHLIQHYGWSTAAISTPLSILASGGTDCSQEFHELHRYTHDQLHWDDQLMHVRARQCVLEDDT